MIEKFVEIDTILIVCLAAIEFYIYLTTGNKRLLSNSIQGMICAIIYVALYFIFVKNLVKKQKFLQIDTIISACVIIGTAFFSYTNADYFTMRKVDDEINGLRFYVTVALTLRIFSMIIFI